MPETSSKIIWIIIVALITLICVFFYVFRATGSNTPQTAETKQAPVQESVWIVEYEAQHDHARNNSVSVTYAIPSDGGVAKKEIGRLEMEENNATWTKTQQFEPGSFLFLTAKSNSYVGGVTCRIKVNGVVISEKSSKVSYETAVCTNQ